MCFSDRGTVVSFELQGYKSQNRFKENATSIKGLKKLRKRPGDRSHGNTWKILTNNFQDVWEQSLWP